MSSESNASAERPMTGRTRARAASRGAGAKDRTRDAVQRIDAAMEERAHQQDQVFAHILDELKQRELAEA
jgi:hypothetical protein